MIPVEVIDEAEAIGALRRYLAAGCEVLAQQFASGRREGVTLFLANGEVRASCGAVAHRTAPPLGGVSVMRESIAVSDEVLDASVSLATAIGLEGPCEVEFRRDASGTPLLIACRRYTACGHSPGNSSALGITTTLTAAICARRWPSYGAKGQPSESSEIAARRTGDARWWRLHLRAQSFSAPSFC